MIDDALLSDNDSIIPVVYLVLRLETPKMSYMSTPLFDTRLIGLEVPGILTQLIIGSDNQSYEG